MLKAGLIGIGSISKAHMKACEKSAAEGANVVLWLSADKGRQQVMIHI